MVEDAVKEARNGTVIAVEVSPQSKKIEFGYDKWRKAIIVKVKSPAKEGKANRELLKIFSEIFGFAEIVKGEKSRSKIVLVKAEKSEVIEKLRKLVEKK